MRVPRFVATALMNRGYALLDAEEYSKALKVSGYLRRIRHTSAIEIQARAEWALGEEEKAVETLREGIRLAPGIYVFWEYLGHYLSDLGFYGDAIDAFENGRRCEGSSEAVIDYNVAVVYCRQGRYDEALALIERVEGTEAVPAVMVAGFRIDALNGLGRHREARELADSWLARPELDHRARSRLMADRAHALEGMGDRLGAEREALEAARLWKGCSDALRLLRELRGRVSPSARGWRLTVEGLWRRPFEGDARDHGSMTTFMVVADSAEEGLEYARELEPEPLRETCKLAGAEDLGEEPERPKGVYWAAEGYTFFTIRDRDR